MSALAKVLVVLNLILALFFLGVTSTLFTQGKNWVETNDKIVEQAKANVEGMTKTIDTKNELLDRRDETIVGHRNEIRTLNETKTRLEAENGDLKGDVARKRSEIDTLEDRLAQKDRHLEQQDNQIAQLTDRLASATEVADQAAEAKKTAEMRYARAKLVQDQTAKEYDAIAKELTDKNKLLSEAERALKIAEEQGFDIRGLVKVPPPIDGVVAAVSPDVDLVVLSVGADENVQQGYEFTIYRNDRFIGKAKVRQVTQDMSGAKILFTEDGEKVQVGDKVSTRITH